MSCKTHIQLQNENHKKVLCFYGRLRFGGLRYRVLSLSEALLSLVTTNRWQLSRFTETTKHRPDIREVVVRFPIGAKYLSFHRSVQTGCETHPIY
jgi:hypothetical protein